LSILSVGSQIKKHRVKRGFTQQELANLSDLSLPFINLVENEKRNLSVDTLIRILNALNVTPSEFFLPFSDNYNNDLSNLISSLQVNDNKERYINLFIEIINLGKIEK
jgi:transcription regulator